MLTNNNTNVIYKKKLEMEVERKKILLQKQSPEVFCQKKIFWKINLQVFSPATSQH